MKYIAIMIMANLILPGMANSSEILEFWNNSSSAFCKKKNINGKKMFFSQLHKRPHRWEVAMECIREDSGKSSIHKKNKVFGTVSMHPVRINSKNNKLTDLVTVYWSAQANPHFCDNKVAYWGLKEGKDGSMQLKAIVVDVQKNRVVKYKNMDLIEGRLYGENNFTKPLWNSSCTSAKFNYSKKSTILKSN